MRIQTGRFAKVKAEAAAEICGRVELSLEARQLLASALSPQGLLSLLAANGLFADAVRFMAFALPAREGVWWSCVTGELMRASLAAKDEIGFEAAESWVYEPTEDRRHACLAAAEAAALDGAGAYAALAAFWSGPSLAPPDLPPVPPDGSLSPTGVGASVLLAVASGDLRHSERNFAAAIERAVDIANGGSGRVGGSRG